MHQAISLHSSRRQTQGLIKCSGAILLRSGAERSKEAAEQERMLKAIELGDLRGEMEELIKGSQEWEDRIVSSSTMSSFT